MTRRRSATGLKIDAGGCALRQHFRKHRALGGPCLYEVDGDEVVVGGQAIEHAVGGTDVDTVEALDAPRPRPYS